MGISNGKIVLFENDKGQVIKRDNKLKWRYYNGQEYDCDVQCLELSERDFSEMYETMKLEKDGSRIVNHCIIYCNCNDCHKVSFDRNSLPKTSNEAPSGSALPILPKKWIKNVILGTRGGDYVTYSLDKIKYKLNGYLSLYQESVNIFSSDFKKFIFNFEGVTFSAYILILKAKLE